MAQRAEHDLTGLAVVALAGGERIGRIGDVIFQTSTGRITGFLIDTGGLFAKPRYLAAEHSQSLGADALTVPENDVLQDSAPETQDTIAAKNLSGRPVLNESGAVLGKVMSYEVNDAEMTLALVLTLGILDSAFHHKPLLPLTVVKAIGKDSLIVPDSYDPKEYR
jgi:uncharacterized protein YrrD